VARNHAENASKANAVLELKEKLGCEKLVVFGDGKNDLDMFHAADEAYAVQNADKELKAAATAVIGGNNEDGVAKWLLEHAFF
jgi:hydroxymethylpyrimidine pyrophosphatase-like HAD family hydrolase